MSKPTITAHMVVKNEDQWVWYAIQSILPYVDSFLITDTGSSDKTVDCIHKIDNQKIIFNRHITSSAKEVVAVRQAQLKATTTDWLWMIDGDEIYPTKTAEEIVEHLEPTLAGVIVRRYDCLGDIYHYQPNEMVGGYTMFQHTAHYSLRLVNCHLRGLTLQGEYPNEGFYDGNKKQLLDYKKSSFYITNARFLHTTYLKRSSLGGNLSSTLHRSKYKVELGKVLPSSVLPEVFQNPVPKNIPQPQPRDIMYELHAAMITPIKIIKRKLFK